jgi:hypothetical protein
VKCFKGTPYSYLQHVGIVLGKVIPFLRSLPFIRNGKGKGNCSESMARLMRDNCAGAESDPKLSEKGCEWADPFNMVIVALQYGKVDSDTAKMLDQMLAIHRASGRGRV